MIQHIALYSVCAFVAVTATLICLNAPFIAKRFRLFDLPGGRKLHATPTPLMGGAAILTAFAPVLLLYCALREPTHAGYLPFIGYAIAMLGCAIVGLSDDIRPRGAMLRFSITAAIIAIVLVFFPQMVLQQLDLHNGQMQINLGWGVGLIFTLFVLLGFINALNMADGKNGLVIGIVMIWTSVFLVMDWEDMYRISVPLLVMASILLVFNYRGKLFLGDGGTYGFAAIIGLQAITIYNSGGSNRSVDQFILMFDLPVIDMMRLIVARRLDGRSSMSSDRDHLHHHLQDVLGWPGGLFVYWLMIIIPNALGLMFPNYRIWLVVASLATYALAIFATHPKTSPIRSPAP